MRRELTMLYTRFYLPLFFGLFLMYHFWHWREYLVFFAYSFWLPQFGVNAMEGTRKSFDKTYLIGMSFCRLSLPLFLWGCLADFNFLICFFPTSNDSGAQIEFCMNLSGWIFFQVFLLFLQDKYGAQFFIPAQFLPPKYNYHRAIPSTVQDLSCVICMQQVNPMETQYMITPCDHVFHDECLRQWLQIKLECPTCRSTIPQVD